MAISPETIKIGWIGTGVMGQSMCGHMIDKGYQTFIYNRSKSKAQNLMAKGGRWCNSPEEVAQNADVIFIIVGFPEDVKSCVLSRYGILNAAKPDSIIIDMTTSTPSLAIEIYQVAKEKNINTLDAPVSGGDIGAKNATLSIMVGGDQNIFETVLPLFEILGKTIVYQGPAGSGQHTKMANQILIATNIIGVCEALLYGYKAGLELNTLVKSVASGAAGSWSLANYGPRIIQNRFEPGFLVNHFIKDLGIALAESKKMNLSLPGLALAEQLYLAVKDRGYGNLGTHSLMLALAELSNVDWQQR